MPLHPRFACNSLQLANYWGSLLAEKVFAYPGLGQATIDAGLHGDIPLLMGIVMFCAILVFCGNSIANALLHRLNRGLRGNYDL